MLWSIAKAIDKTKKHQMPVQKYQNLINYIYIILSAFVSREKCIIIGLY